MIETAAQTKCQIVVLRPITLDVSVHKNATEFAKDYCPEGVKIVFLRSVACGRSSDAFKRRWDKYENKNKLVASGAAFEMDLEDLGAEYAENLSFVKKPLRDVVAGRFDHLSAKSQLEAKEIYDADARAHIALWLKAHEAKFAEALRALGVKL
jgi:hypothetical protein